MIRIEKDKIFYIDPTNEPHEIYPSEIPTHLGDSVELGEFVTFSRIFDLIVDNKSLFNIIFAKDLGYSQIDQYLEEYDRPATHNGSSYDLEVDIVCQAHNYQDYRHFEYYVSFHGLGILEDDKESVEPYPISLSFTSINELKNKYIWLNTDVKIDTYAEEGSIESSEEYEGDIKLYDFFAAILNEISFFGDPENRDEISEEITERAESVENEEEELVSWEDVQEEWNKELKEAEKEEEKERHKTLKEHISSGYLTQYIESTFQESIENLETLESDLVSLERYEDARLVRAKIDKLKSCS